MSIIGWVIGLGAVYIAGSAVEKIDEIKSRNKFEKMSGYDFEQYCANYLKRCGYTNVDVTPKSGDFGADIIATTPGKLFSGERKRICIQCKKYKKPVGVKAVQEVIGGMSYYHCSCGMVLSNAEFTKAAHELAETSGVTLRTID